MNYDSPESLQFSLLVLEDDSDEQKLLSTILDRYFPDWKYHFASDEKELLDFLKTKSHFSLLLLDINIPGNDGVEVLKLIRQIESYRSIPVIGFSNSQEKALDVILNGATAFFKKPVDTDDLIKLLKTLPSYGSRL